MILNYLINIPWELLSQKASVQREKTSSWSGNSYHDHHIYPKDGRMRQVKLDFTSSRLRSMGRSHNRPVLLMSYKRFRKVMVVCWLLTVKWGEIHMSLHCFETAQQILFILGVSKESQSLKRSWKTITPTILKYINIGAKIRASKCHQ